jgi:uncharacterized protein YqgV (UPF0045/DUF77 family)
MKISVELSLYPLCAQPIPPIQDFIDRLRTHEGLQVLTNTMSTQVHGEYELVFAVLQQEMRATFEGDARSVFIAKFLGPAKGQDD